MSPLTMQIIEWEKCVPRASGDEPYDEPGARTMPECSPRERG